MAFALRNQNDSEVAPMADMNVTPLVDVMLVLLIVFMVAAPLMAVGVPVDLPKVAAKQLNEQKPPIAVSIDAEGNFFIDQKAVTSESLFDELNAATENDKERRIHVRGDKNVTYGKVIEAMGKINASGFTKVALVSEAPAPSAPSPR
ncbi:Cell division and transport-associated protein TolR [Rhodoblastus acidophilus]|uniref:Cell division and transport-associated protein TolR n=1 Tax=Rhodoblastus acidophilus TaxID=1074 RepID=A0A212PZD5_RHOAC|nr:protein TolR [Rhodoblastus acidophilus]MCW2318015.1 biopolymer transport protein ExbD/biopolymer transport protein TolR [Rhodoblastus acidophilus]PPQ38678.1 protein TolR [Rhodoblastus acidophilus]RAI17825.1 protein TolR [Rhodoblastus acidophilus]SNB52380.1 Cell division and transport-associated protein TolR [Rhodoblastus acidophilus]